MFGKLLKITLLTVIAYLLQVTVAFHISLWNVAPNIALAIVSIVSIGLGRKYTFFMSLTIGYLREIMMPALGYIELILYPVCAMLGALAFSDKSERKLEEERSSGKRTLMPHAHIRTPLCAATSVMVYEAVHLVYIYLDGVAIDSSHLFRALVDVLYTTLLAGLLQFPTRWWLKVYKVKKARR
ncbi:MAG: hypothetical protein FWF86_08630 [Clostridia bacterium]|nr:hypothetical protein [Clostridia bacterium]